MIWNIVSDSSCDLRMSSFESDTVRFETVPLRIQVGDQEFIDNADLVIPDMPDAMASEKSAASMGSRGKRQAQISERMGHPIPCR